MRQNCFFRSATRTGNGRLNLFGNLALLFRMKNNAAVFTDKAEHYENDDERMETSPECRHFVPPFSASTTSSASSDIPMTFAP